jgi:hypothetical protein
MKQVKATRQAAVQAAQDALIERVTKTPEKVLDTLLLHPHLLNGVHDVELMFDIMLEAGQRDKLITLAGSRGFPRNLSKVLVGKLL